MKIKTRALCCLLLVFITGSSFSHRVIIQDIPKDGVYKEYYPSGSIKIRGHYKASQKQGLWLYYATNGPVEKKEKYRNGELQWQIYYNDRGKITKTVDKKGIVTERPKCGC